MSLPTPRHVEWGPIRVRELVEVCERLGIMLETSGEKLWYWPAWARAEHPELLVELKRHKLGLIEYIERGEVE